MNNKRTDGIVDGFERMFGTDPIKALENMYTKTGKDFGLDEKDYQTLVYCFTKSYIGWILEVIKAAKKVGIIK